MVGAGASVAEAKGHRPAQDKSHPPLDANFFERVERHQKGPLLQRVQEHADALGYPELCDRSGSISLEQFLGRLFFEMHNKKTEDNVHSYFDLVRLYTNELLTTTNWMVGRGGSIKKLLERERQGLRRITVLTFNHDLLIENALSQLYTRRFGNAWCLRHCYGFADELETCSNGSEEYEYTCPGQADLHVRVLKLHGSVNWVFKTRGRYPPRDFARRPRDLLLWNNTSIPAGFDRITGGKRYWYLWPLIVPPIYEKQGLIRNELAGVWANAASALRSATRILFWGYSFPRADLHARYFFQAAAQENESLRQPILINPDAAVHREMSDILEPGKVTQYHDVQDYLDDNV